MVNVLERMNFSDYQTSITPKQYKQLVKMMTKNGNIETFWYMGIWIHPYIFATGRIKRMRGITSNRWPSIYKRIGRKRYVTILRIMDDDLFEKIMFGITRWNRH